MTTEVKSGQEVEMGTFVGTYPIDMYKVSEGGVDLITILSKNPIVTRTCYHDKVGFRFHENSASMRVGLQPSIHYNFLIALWNADKSGSQIIDEKYTLYSLSVPEKIYKRLVRKYELNGDLRQLVLQVELEGEVKYQGMNFEVTRIKPPYMASKALFAQLKEEITEYVPVLAAVRAGILTDEAFMELWQKEGSAVEKETDSRYKDSGKAQLSGNTNKALGAMKEEDFNFDDAKTKELPKKQEKVADVEDAKVVDGKTEKEDISKPTVAEEGDFSFED